MNADNRKKDVLILGKSSADRLDDTTIKAQGKYFIITKSGKKTCFSLHFNGRKSFLQTNGVNICQIKAKDSRIKLYLFQKISQLGT